MGRSVRCSVCGHAVFVPAAKTRVGAQLANQEVQAWIRVLCRCGKVIKVPPHWAGKRGHCPRCGIEKIMPLHVPAEPQEEHDAEPLDDQHDGSESAIFHVTADEPILYANLERPLPRPQPHDEIVPDGEVYVGGDESGMFDPFAASQIVHPSGLLDLTGAEEVKIVDGVAPALWEAKRVQRAAALKAGATAQTKRYVRRSLTERVIRVRRRVDTLLFRNPAVTIAVSLAVLLCSVVFLYHSLRHGAGPPDPNTTQRIVSSAQPEE